MNQSNPIVTVHWDGIVQAQIVDRTHDSVTLQRVVQQKNQYLPFGEQITVTRDELASLAR